MNPLLAGEANDRGDGQRNVKRGSCRSVCRMTASENVPDKGDHCATVRAVICYKDRLGVFLVRRLLMAGVMVPASELVYRES